MGINGRMGRVRSGLRRLFFFSCGLRVDTPRYVACRAVEEGSKSARAIGLCAGKHAVGFQALEEDRLYRVIDLLTEWRSAPAGPEIGAACRCLAAGESR